MVFSSPVFLFLFLPVVFIIYKLVPTKLKNYILVVASLFFYAWGEPIYILLMLLSVAINYIIARAIGKAQQTMQTGKTWVALCVVFNIGMLFVFKYSNFFVENINSMLGTALMIPDIRLPIGISFYTFQAMSYVIDVYRKTSKAQKNYTNVLLYISFFPQLIAGPIVKYHDIAQQIEQRSETLDKTAAGLKRFAVGLAKKLLIANAMGVVADKVFGLVPGDVNIAVAWLGALTYALQIYFDFSGYSDMAIGLAKIFGFELKENFNYPYTANSIKTFWRRWHISLSTWFKEYLYIPLGGNRKGTVRTSLNLIIVFFCTGLWHGAEWTFVVWGFFHGLFIMLERVGVLRPQKAPKWLGTVYTLLIVVTAFTIFRAETLAQAFDFIAKMFVGFGTTPRIQSIISETVTWPLILFFAMAVAGSTPFIKNGYQRLQAKWPGAAKIGTSVAALLVLVLCMLMLASQTYNPFIYFRF